MATTPHKVYSTRFQHRSGGQGTATYVVAVGKRAVVAFVGGCNNDTNPGRIFCQIQGITFTNVNLPAYLSNAYWEGRAVAYGGETITLGTLGNSTSAHCAGYLFDDPGGTTAADPPYPYVPDFPEGAPPVELGD